MATAEDLMKVLRATEENNKRLSEELLKVASQKISMGKKWYEADRYKNLKEFDGKNDYWEEWHVKINGIIKSGEPEVVEILEKV